MGVAQHVVDVASRSLWPCFVLSSLLSLVMATQAFGQRFDKDPSSLTFEEKKHLITRNLQAREIDGSLSGSRREGGEGREGER